MRPTSGNRFAREPIQSPRTATDNEPTAGLWETGSGSGEAKARAKPDQVTKRKKDCGRKCLPVKPVGRRKRPDLRWRRPRVPGGTLMSGNGAVWGRVRSRLRAFPECLAACGAGCRSSGGAEGARGGVQVGGGG